MAAGKSLQLARSLRSVATRIPAEDVQRAAKEITSCLSNLLTVRPFPFFPCEMHFDPLGREWSLAATDNGAGSGLQPCEHLT